MKKYIYFIAGIVTALIVLLFLLIAFEHATTTILFQRTIEIVIVSIVFILICQLAILALSSLIYIHEEGKEYNEAYLAKYNLAKKIIKKLIPHHLFFSLLYCAVLVASFIFFLALSTHLMNDQILYEVLKLMGFEGVSIKASSATEESLISSMGAILALFIGIIGLSGILIFKRNTDVQRQLEQELESCRGLSRIIPPLQRAFFFQAPEVDSPYFAIREYDQVLLEKNDDPTFYSLRARAHARVNSISGYKKALIDSQKALVLKDDWHPAIFESACAKRKILEYKLSSNRHEYTELGNTNEIKLLKALYSPQYFHNFINKDVYLKLDERPYLDSSKQRSSVLEEIEEVKNHFKKSRDYVGHANFHLEMAEFYKLTEKYDEALYHYRKCYAKNKNDSNTAFLYCIFWSKCYDYADKKELQLKARHLYSHRNATTSEPLKNFTYLKEKLRSDSEEFENQYGSVNTILDILKRFAISEKKHPYFFPAWTYLYAIIHQNDDDMADYLQMHSLQSLNPFFLKDLFHMDC